MNIFVFDIETIPDVATGRKLHDFTDLADEEVAAALFALRREKTGSEFLPHYLQKIVAISCVFRHRDGVKVWSLGDEAADEAELIRRFYHGVEKYTPTLVSWNGSGFDLPVLHYRSLLHKIPAARYWEVGDRVHDFRYNNYLNRYHYRHIDVMDALAAYQNRAFASLQDIAILLGLPGKMGMSGAAVWEYYQRGDLKSIRNYCETDVLNTYLVYLHFALIRGELGEQDFAAECERLQEYLATSEPVHLQEFLAAWNPH